MVEVEGLRRYENGCRRGQRVGEMLEHAPTLAPMNRMGNRDRGTHGRRACHSCPSEAERRRH